MFKTIFGVEFTKLIVLISFGLGCLNFEWLTSKILIPVAIRHTYLNTDCNEVIRSFAKYQPRGHIHSPSFSP
jgi:hypothetical protein